MLVRTNEGYRLAIYLDMKVIQAIKQEEFGTGGMPTVLLI